MHNRNRMKPPKSSHSNYGKKEQISWMINHSCFIISPFQLAQKKRLGPFPTNRRRRVPKLLGPGNLQVQQHDLWQKYWELKDLKMGIL